MDPRSRTVLAAFLLVAGVGAFSPSAARAHAGHHELLGDAEYRSPGLAVALSLTPLPVDFGNLYVENLGWGVAYTAIETSLAIPGMWLAGSHMAHGRDGNRDWSSSEEVAVIALVSVYVVVKVVAAVHAGGEAQRFNESHRRPTAQSRVTIVSWP